MQETATSAVRAIPLANSGSPEMQNEGTAGVASQSTPADELRAMVPTSSDVAYGKVSADLHENALNTETTAGVVPFWRAEQEARRLGLIPGTDLELSTADRRRITMALNHLADAFDSYAGATASQFHRDEAQELVNLRDKLEIGFCIMVQGIAE